MTYNIGNLCLIATMLLSLGSSSTFFTNSKKLSSFIYKSISLEFLIVTIALLKLIESYISSDYSFVNVASNTHTLVPIIYKIAGVWGNHEGSMLLIVWLLGLINIIFMTKAEPNNKQEILSLQSLLTFLLTSFVFFVSNPFTTTTQATTGHGFNPLLQDYTLAVHPPILYTGYLGFSIAFSAMISGLKNENIGSTYLYILYPWIIVPWGFLTLGISLGSWWAYRELGWGGFWFWDPVENVSLVVWCSAISLLHIIKLTIKKKLFYQWTTILGILTFILSILSLLLVRSGALVSVHSFAVDQSKGIGLMLILVIIVTVSVYTWLKHHKSLPRYKKHVHFFSKSSGILLNNIFIMTTCLIIILALLYPVFLGLIQNKTVSVGELFYQETLEFIFLPTVFFMILFPFLKWDDTNFKNQVQRLLISTITSAIIVTLINLGTSITNLGTNLYIFSAIASIISTIIYFVHNTNHAKLSMHLGHFGFAFLILGAAFCWTWQSEEEFVLAKNQSHLTTKKYEASLEQITYKQGENYLSRTAIIKIYSNNMLLGSVTPETRFYPIEKTFTHESSIMHTWLGDIYVTIGEITNNKNISIKIKYKPFVYLIWCGSVLMAISAFFYVLTRKRNDIRHNQITRKN